MAASCVCHGNTRQCLPLTISAMSVLDCRRDLRPAFSYIPVVGSSNSTTSLPWGIESSAWWLSSCYSSQYPWSEVVSLLSIGWNPRRRVALGNKTYLVKKRQIHLVPAVFRLVCCSFRFKVTFHTRLYAHQLTAQCVCIAAVS